MKKVISLFLTILTVISFGICSYAETKSSIPGESVPMENRYRYKMEYEYINSKNIYVSEEEAETELKFETALRSSMVGMTLAPFAPLTLAAAGSFAEFAVSKFYASPYNAAGNYSVKVYSARRLRIDRLTGEKHTIRSGYKFKATHKSHTYSRTFWF